VSLADILPRILAEEQEDEERGEIVRVGIAASEVSSIAVPSTLESAEIMKLEA
jgi:hypothetical protein